MTNVKRTAASIATVALLAAVGWLAPRGAAPANAQPAPAPPAIVKALPEAQRMLETARAGESAVTQTIEVNAPTNGPHAVATRAAWAKRVFEAELAIAPDRAARVKAAEAHVARQKAFVEMLDARHRQGMIGAIDMIEGRYQLAEAEWTLARLKAE